MRFALAFAALVCAASPGRAASGCLASRDAYEKIKRGMSAGEVTAIVGCEPQRTHAFEAPEDPPIELTWDSEQGYGQLTVLIEHGRVRLAEQPAIY